MGKTHTCPRCKEKKTYKIRREKRRCSACRYEWTPGKLPHKFSRKGWATLLQWFLWGVQTRALAETLKTNRWRIQRGLTTIRTALLKDLQKSNNDAPPPLILQPPTILHGSQKNPAPLLALRMENNLGFVKILSPSESEPIIEAINRRRKTKIEIPGLNPFQGLLFMKKFHSLSQPHSKTQASPTSLAPLQRLVILVKKGVFSHPGVRPSHWPLYLAETLWKFNNRKTPGQEQIRIIWKLLVQSK